MAEYNLAQTGNLSPEDFAQQQQLNRQQQMAQMLLQQSGQPQGQMISGRYVAPSWAQQLAPLANIAASKYIGEKADTQAAQLAQAIRQNKSAANQAVLDKFLGTPDQVTEMAGPYAGNVPMPVATKEGQKPDYAAALREINSPTNYYGAGKDLLPSIMEQLAPKQTPEQIRYKAAIADGSFKGGFNAFLNQMNEKDKASLAIERARLGLAQQELAFNTGGMGMPSGVPQGQAPLRTINPGSPILAPGQQQVMPQQGMPPAQMPRFNSKAEQDVWIATQKEKGKLQAEAQNALPAALQTAQTGISAINELIGDTTVDSKGNVVYGKQRPKAGFEQSVGMPTAGSLFGVTNLFPGSDAADFKAAFDQIGGQAFLGAIGTLKGTGQITEIEGAKATAALNRMKLSQSEPEFIKAANDFKEVLQKGYKTAQQRAGAAPMDLNAQPSTNKPRLVYDPATGTLK